MRSRLVAVPALAALLVLGAPAAGASPDFLLVGLCADGHGPSLMLIPLRRDDAPAAPPKACHALCERRKPQLGKRDPLP